MNETPPDMNRDELDRQIRAALQVEPLPPQLARLETFWQRRRHTQRRHRFIAVASPLAALLLVAVTISLHLYQPHSRPGQVVVDVPRHVKPVVPRVDGAQVVTVSALAPSPEREQPQLTARKPTTYERFVLVARSPRTVGRPPVVAGVARLVERLKRDGETDAERLVRESGLVPSALEQELLRRLVSSGDDETRTVLQLIAVCGSSRSAAPLLRLAERPEFRDEALTAVEGIVGATGMPAVAGRTADPRLRAAIFRRLLMAGDDGLEVYLALIHDGSWGTEALGVADEVSGSLLSRLVDRLDDESKDVRLAAALVLAHANGPAVTRELIGRVTDRNRPPSTTEAWIALLGCRDEQAERFFAYARRQPQLLAPFNRACMWWTRATL